MKGIISNDITRLFKILVAIAIVLGCISLVVRSESLFALTLGILVSVIANLMLLYAAYKVVYRKSGRGAMLVDYSKRCLLYVMALYFVYKFSKNNVEINILCCFLGFLSFKGFLYLSKIFLKDKL